MTPTPDPEDSHCAKCGRLEGERWPSPVGDLCLACSKIEKLAGWNGKASWPCKCVTLAKPCQDFMPRRSKYEPVCNRASCGHLRDCHRKKR